MLYRYRFLSIALASIIGAAPLMANDIKPPHYRGLVHSTSAGWQFTSDQALHDIRPDADVPLRAGDAADALADPFPDGAPYPSAATFGDMLYTEELGGGYYSITPGDNGLVFTIPGFLGETTSQLLRIQTVFNGPEPAIVVKGFLGIPGTSAEVEESALDRVPIPGILLPPGSEFFYEDWYLKPGATWLNVYFFLEPETLLQSVVIDTLSGKDPLFEDGFEDE
ncbi:MAG: hypothetical protein AAFY88_02635 [Acidobacteriota bacterium]